MKQLILFALAILSCSLLTAQHIHSDGAQFDRAEYRGDTTTVKTKIPILDENNLLNHYAEFGDLLELVPLPDLNNYVTLDGNETITGQKTIDNYIHFNNGLFLRPINSLSNSLSGTIGYNGSDYFYFKPKGTVGGFFNLDLTELTGGIVVKPQDRSGTLAYLDDIPSATTVETGFGLSKDSEGRIQLGEPLDPEYGLAPGTYNVNLNYGESISLVAGPTIYNPYISVNNGWTGGTPNPGNKLVRIGNGSQAGDFTSIVVDSVNVSIKASGQTDVNQFDVGTSGIRLKIGSIVDNTGKYLKAIDSEGTLEYSDIPTSSVVAGNGITVDDTDPTNPVISSTGIQAIDEGNGIGWRLIGRNSSNYGNLGLDAIDLSNSTVGSSTYGATGTRAIAFGVNVSASGSDSAVLGGNSGDAIGTSSVIIGGYNSQATSQYSLVIGGHGNTSTAVKSVAIGGHQIDATAESAAVIAGVSNEASGNRSAVLGGSLSIASGFSSAVLGGTSNYARSLSEVSMGMHGTDYTPSSINAFQNNDRLLNVGNGIGTSSRSDAFTILKSGKIGVGINNFEANNTTSKMQVNGTIENTATGGALILKSPNGSRWEIKVDNSGVISATAL